MSRRRTRLNRNLARARHAVAWISYHEKRSEAARKAWRTRKKKTE